MSVWKCIYNFCSQVQDLFQLISSLLFRLYTVEVVGVILIIPVQADEIMIQVIPPCADCAQICIAHL